MSGREQDVGHSYDGGYQKRIRKEEREMRPTMDSQSNKKIVDFSVSRATCSSADVIKEPLTYSATEEPTEPPKDLENDSQDLESTRPEQPEPEVQQHNQRGGSESFEGQTVTFPEDPNLWTDITHELRSYFSQKKFEQDLDALNLKTSAKTYDDERTEYLNKGIFFRKLANGEKVRRRWMIFSESSGMVFCYVCKLFSSTQSALTIGFNDWKNVHCLLEHENSIMHRESMSAYYSFGHETGRADKTLFMQLQKEKEYWRNTLKRVVSVVKFLAERGQNEEIGSENNGNILGIIELLAQYDVYLADHLNRFGNAGRGIPSYLSSTVCNEFIHLMAKQVTTTIVSEVKAAKYYSISVDSTPDVTLSDQLVFILRYVSADGIPVERFLKFIENKGHDAEYLTNVVLSTLHDLDIPISNCRGQSYDNASNMVGNYSEVQQRIRNINSFAHIVPCSAHSLNLVGSCATERCIYALSFFGFMQTLYNFFSASTCRWKLLKDFLREDGIVPKSLSNTRWSARYDATRALKESYKEIHLGLQAISTDKNETPQTRCEASILARKMKHYECAILCILWDKVLHQFNNTSKALQKETIELSTVVHLYEGLVTYTKSLRTEYELFEQEAKMLVDDLTYNERQTVKRKRFFDESKEASAEVALPTARENFRTMTFLVILDSLIAELDCRKQGYAELHDQFGLLFELQTLSTDKIRSLASKLLTTYSTDLEESFPDEIIHFCGHLSKLKKDLTSPQKMLEYIRGSDIVEVFPNVEIALRIYLTLPAINTGGECSFSVLKRVKNRLHSSLTQDRLSDLSILTIESDITQTVNFEHVIDEFACSKARKRVVK